RDERELVIKAILEMGHIPVGMEMFSAGDEQQWKLIQTQIDDCDYYVVISAFRYGSLDNEISYTEKEYDYAVQKEIPVLGFVIQEGVSWPSDRVDQNAAKVEKLVTFKHKIKGKLISFWKDKNDLYGKVSIALMKQFNTNPRIGWVKSSEHSGPEVLKEISRLSNENNALRDELARFYKQCQLDKKEEFQKTLDVLKHNKRNLSFFYRHGYKFEDDREYTLMEIFDLLAPELMIENSTIYCAYYLGSMLRPDQKRAVRQEWTTPSNVVKKILADLNVLELIQPSTKKHSIKDENDYWTLTSEGKKVFKVIRRELLDKNLEISLNENGYE
ncbi:MAG: DUF4062 domain-containing protein, partial [Lutibacter sp.]|nr:DUF4062 domain-containing protein [Lutibacter sp.]